MIAAILAAAAVPSLFGVQVGAPLQLPRCASRYAPPTDSICWWDATPGAVLLHFGTGPLPFAVNGAPVVILDGGNVASVIIHTAGLQSQDETYSALRAKLGRPFNETRTPVTNLMGVRATRIAAKWIFPGGSVRFNGFDGDDATTGGVYMSTYAYDDKQARHTANAF